MSKQVQTTAIKKKYKDKKTGEWRETTINNARVPDRLVAFREEHPRASVKTDSVMMGDYLKVTAYILRDKADPNSADATGQTMERLEDKPEKQLESLETKAVGRALALLGYLNDGRVASTEEMEEWEAEQKRKKEEAITFAIDEINATTSVDELKDLFTKRLGVLTAEEAVVEAKNERYKELKDATSQDTTE